MKDLVGSIADAMMAQNAEGAVKVEADLERYKRVIDATHPDLVIETGTLYGRSALWFAEQGLHVITVDIDPKVFIATWKEWAYRVDPIAGSSTDPVIVDEVKAAADGYDRVMVVLDSDHSAAHVAAELAIYADLVTPGQYLVVEDTIVRWMPWARIVGSPLDAVEDFLLVRGDKFVVDVELEDWSPRTQHPSGWLWRKPAGWVAP